LTRAGTGGKAELRTLHASLLIAIASDEKQQERVPRRVAMRLPIGVAAASVLLGMVTWGTTPAMADAQQNQRILTCGGEQVVTYLSGGGFGTPYHVVGSTEVIVPKIVTVIFPGSDDPVTTLYVPGFDVNQAGTVNCSYTDPQGLKISVIGLRT
jgi:hypothetical protein